MFVFYLSNLQPMRSQHSCCDFILFCCLISLIKAGVFIPEKTSEQKQDGEDVVTVTVSGTLKAAREVTLTQSQGLKEEACWEIPAGQEGRGHARL